MVLLYSFRNKCMLFLFMRLFWLLSNLFLIKIYNDDNINIDKNLE